MSHVHAILHPVGITVSRLSIPAWEFNKYVAKGNVGPQLLLHDVFRYDHGDALLVCKEIWKRDGLLLWHSTDLGGSVSVISTGMSLHRGFYNID